MKDLTSYLFETNAFKICEENKPFWYTSGKIGPYFVNTHFLYGNSEDANKLLEFIDDQLANHDKLEIPKNIFEKVLSQYKNNEIFNFVINDFITFLKTNININDVDYVSGGERRDWYFSNIVAYLLEKPHITIYKDLSAVESTYNFEKTKNIENLNNKKVLHVADLLNQASSYLRAWIPAIENFGGKILWSAVIVDRMQGGTQKLEDAKIKSLSLLQIDNNLFKKALDLNIINESQLAMLTKFASDPDKTMRDFLISHPDFIQNALNGSDAKSAKRAKLCIDSNLYDLN